MYGRFWYLFALSWSFPLCRLSFCSYFLHYRFLLLVFALNLHTILIKSIILSIRDNKIIKLAKRLEYYIVDGAWYFRISHQTKNLIANAFDRAFQYKGTPQRHRAHTYQFKFNNHFHWSRARNLTNRKKIWTKMLDIICFVCFFLFIFVSHHFIFI